MRKVFQRFNSLFGRLAFLSISVLVLTQLTWVWAIEHDRADGTADYISRLLQFAVSASRDGITSQEKLRSVFRLQFLAPGQDPVAAGCPAPCADTNGPFERRLRGRLPPSSRVVFDNQSSVVWIGYAFPRPSTVAPSAVSFTPQRAFVRTWMTLPLDVPGRGRLIGVNASMLLIAILIALFGAWQIQRPLSRLARAARELRSGHRPEPLKPDGPSEVKALMNDFNDMSNELTQADHERSVMLAGVAHDLRAPLTRIQVRASLVDNASVQAGFLRDSASLSQIVTQFLDFARDAEPAVAASTISVDQFCQTHYAHPAEDIREALIELDLRAGDGFRLPGVELDRILSNLIENAFTYGAPPLTIHTSKRNGDYILSVRDHGEGIAPADLERALRPFVRLDPARGGDAHCGLGLTIVRRLTRRYAGDLSIDNADDGGLCVTLRFAV